MPERWPQFEEVSRQVDRLDGTEVAMEIENLVVLLGSLSVTVWRCCILLYCLMTSAIARYLCRRLDDTPK